MWKNKSEVPSPVDILGQRGERDFKNLL